ncbi:MAG: phospho-sugar mutase, partial [Spirochaetia bacterium]|nr:phospho-sugar mutase [Spirochaetia bacterium]
MEKAEIIKLANEYMEKELDEGFRNQVKKLLADENFTELEDCFYKSLDFGTGGIRGVIGGGYNRINPYIIKKVTQGLATYINKAAAGKCVSVVLAHDSRRCSRLFAETAASVFCGNGIKTYLFTSLRPTPELSFAVRHLGCISGVVVTASHNPAEYNGYKVYWDDGGQVVPPQDAGIIAEVNSVKSITSMPLEEAAKKWLFQLIDKEVDDAFLDMVRGCSLRPELIK